MHSMLSRQLRRAFKANTPEEADALVEGLYELAARDDADPKHAQALHGLRKLLDMVGESYQQFDRAQELRLRSLSVSAAELLQANARLRDEAERQRALIDAMRMMANRMLARGARDPIPADEKSAERLAQLMGELISESELAHQYMMESEARYRGLTRLSSDWYWEQDEHQRFTLMSQGITAVTGQDPDDFIGKTRAQAFAGDSPPRGSGAHQRLLQQMLTRQPFRDFEVRFTPPGRDTVYVSLSGEPRTDSGGRFLGYRGIARNITAQTRAELHLREALTLTDTLIESMPMPVSIKDRAHRYVRLNAAYEREFDVRRDIALGKTATEVLNDPTRGGREDEEDMLLNPGVRSYTRMRKTRAGGEKYFVITKATIHDENGAVSGFITTHADVSEFKRTEENLTQAKQVAEQAMRARSQFLANMSHEIRTPMNGVLGMARVLADTPLNTEQKEYLQTIRESGDSLLKIVNDILDFSKIEAGKVEIEHTEFDLRSRVASILQLFAASARGKNLTLASTCAEGVPERVIGDPVRISQTLSNLVANAIKFTETGRIDVHVSAPAQAGDSMMLRIDVRDTGIGISNAAIERIFDPFSQEDASTTRRFGGSGLGLTISRQLAGLMGGELFVESVHGSGSCFSFTVQVSRGTQRQAAPVTAAVAAPPAASAATGKPSPRVLLAEDNHINQIVAVAMLKKLGADVTVAKDGQEAVDMVKARQFDLILMDCHMPTLDGFAATAAIRELERLGHPRHTIIAQTANAMAGDRENCIAAGMDDYLSKPISAAALAQVIHRWAPARKN